MFPRVILVGAFLLQPLFALGYKINHASCNGGKLQQVAKAIDESLESIDEAITEFDQPKEAKELREMLFPDVSATKVLEGLHKINSSMTHSKEASAHEDKRSPLLHCNLDRLVTKTGPAPDYMKYWYDKDSKETSRYVESCDKGASHGFLTTFTEEEPGADGTTFGTRCESQDFIQICQDTWKALDYNLLEGASDEAIAKWEFTPPSDDQDADGYYTAFFMEWVLPLEQTLIHEYAHSADGADLPAEDEYAGWKNCVNPPHKNQDRNPDSYAYLVTGGNMIRRKKQFPLKNGAFKRLSSEKPSKQQSGCNTQ